MYDLIEFNLRNGNKRRRLEVERLEARVCLSHLTGTGFAYPTGTSDLGSYAGWLASGCNGATQYSAGYYHIGKDIRASQGSSVYAVADGQVLQVSTGGWGAGNVALVVRHSLMDGRQFTAVYGHVQTTLSVGSRVSSRQVIARIGPYSPPHLHFGVHPGRGAPAAPLGRMTCSSWPNANGFVDPIGWITQQTPANGRDARAIDDTYARAERDGRFGSVVVGSFGKDVNWSPDWELRWLSFNFSGGRSVRIYQATYKANASLRYTIFWDPDGGRWTNWERATS